MTSPSQDRLYGSNSSLAFKAPCRVATTAGITLSGEQTIDGVSVVAEDRVLVKDQADGTFNGIYIANTSTWDRAPDCDGNRDLAKGCIVRVHSGTLYSSTLWELTTADPIIVGTSTLTWSPFSLTALTAATLTVTNLNVGPGTGNVPGATVGTNSVPVCAVSMKPSVTAGCADIAAVSAGAGTPDMITLNFDSTTSESAQFSIRMPTNWNEGTITFDVQWSHAATTINFGVAFGLSAVARGDGDVIGAAFGTEITVTDTGGTTDTMYISPTSTAMTVAGTPASGDVVYFNLARKTANAADTMAIDARVSGITLYIVTDAAIG